MSDVKQPWIVLYNLKQHSGDLYPLRKMTWLFGTEKEVIEEAKSDMGYFVEVAYLIPAKEFISIRKRYNE